MHRHVVCFDKYPLNSTVHSAAEVVTKKGTWEIEFFDCPKQSSVVDASVRASDSEHIIELHSRCGSMLAVASPQCFPFHIPHAQGKKWVLWQMHIHGTSEHTVDGGYYPMEVHLVHVPAGSDPVHYKDSSTVPNGVLVLGVFLVSPR